MSKIKINLTSGSSIEKPLITCFKGSSSDYIVIDNETTGSMGYPIICISKFNKTEATKITDQTEWASVKESLKSILSGNNPEYISVPETISAQDDFYTQLTLPVASFETIKSAYLPSQKEEVVTESLDAIEDNSMNSIDIGVANIAMSDTEINSVEEEKKEEIPEPVPVVPDSIPTEIPEITMPTEGNVDEVDSKPVEETINNSTSIDDIKKNFMESCEAMFDAMVEQLKNNK